MKAYTDLRQSKKLAEILPLESADMFYDGVQDLYKENVYNIPINGSSITVRTGHIITKKDIKANLLLPCWSLAALIEVLPKICYPVKQDYPTYLTLGKPKDKWCALYWDVTGMQDGEQTLADNPVDVCVEMIIKLHDQKLL